MASATADEAYERAARAVERFCDVHRPVGLIAGVHAPGARTPWIFPWGAVRAEDGAAPDRRTVWQIGSITKTVTATLLADAHLAGLALDAPVQPSAPPGVVLPTFDTWQGATGMRFVDLATHTAGLPLDPRGVPPAGGYSVEEMYRYLDLYALAVAPGASWNYSNTGFGLLANLLVARAGAAGYQELVDGLKLRGRLAMPDTVVDPDAAEERRRAQGYAAPGEPAHRDTPTWPAFDGSGALYSTLDDLLTWLAYNLGLLDSPLAALPEVTQRVYFAREGHVMGLGWELQPYAPDRRCWSKGGNTSGFTSYVSLSRELGGGVVILCNSLWVWCEELAMELLVILEQGATGVRAAGRAPS